MKKNKGFVLAELLVGVSVLIITFSVIGVNASKINKELNQLKANSIARHIFVEAQDQLTRMHASGSNSIINGQRDFSYDPETYTGTNKLKYIYSTDSDIDSFCDLKEGSYVIEYDSVFGHVYGVFYSTLDLSEYTTEEQDDFWRRHATQSDYYDFAEDNKYNIAYYGGEVMDVTIQVPDPTHMDTGFCYYEVYADDNNINTLEYGYYIFGTRTDTLQDRVVVGDGYGVLIDDTMHASDISISGTKSINLGACSFIIINDGGLIMKFPSEWMCANWLLNTAITKTTPTRESKYNQDYWWNITVDYGDSTETWSYSPYYAKSAISFVDSKNLPSTVYIRSARQLNALSWMYPSYYNKKWAWDWTETRVSNTTFKQEVDIDYNKYKFMEYTGREFVGQLPIGTDWGRFVSTYDGGGKTIYNCKLLRRNTTGNEYSYAGLFGFVSNGKIHDVHLDGNGIEVKNADYCGILAAYVQNETITKSSVNNYIINYEKQSAAPSNTSSPNEFKYARIGGFIGYLKAPTTNEPGSSSISDCSVTNLTLKANNYMSTESDSRATNRCYNIGGFIGSIADREQSETNGKKVTVSNCSVQATISTKSTGNMAWFNIGGFAGACGWPSVTNCITNVSGLTKNQMATYYKSYGK